MASQDAAQDMNGCSWQFMATKELGEWAGKWVFVAKAVFRGCQKQLAKENAGRMTTEQNGNGNGNAQMQLSLRNTNTHSHASTARGEILMENWCTRRGNK